MSCETCRHQDCDGSKGFSRFVMQGEHIPFCPISVANPEIIIMIGAYNHYKNGYLPGPGGIYDQTAKFMRAVDVIGNVIHQHDEAERKKQDKPRG
ncbi:hypothetical protein [Nitrospina gracilis]|uniref:hypothetical protein n=1 Tax=Nitrospina gracilis TaxID=35801 RepID=UPI001F24067F|nr:hypothetical protein [Nitrospina gracilis]MCF8719210.1 hypothetical protein [Nitrospina gracilis Nb-211]